MLKPTLPLLYKFGSGIIDSTELIRIVKQDRIKFKIRASNDRPEDYAVAFLIGKMRLSKEHADELERARISVIRAPNNLRDASASKLRSYFDEQVAASKTMIGFVPSATAIPVFENSNNHITEEEEQAWLNKFQTSGDDF